VKLTSIHENSSLQVGILAILQAILDYVSALLRISTIE
jgi:hypothetical protein